jgi:hypothetical protein
MGIVHLRILTLASPATGIGHLPIVATRVASVLEVVVDESAEIPSASVSAVQRWRTKHTAGEAGAFSVSIREAIALTLEVAGHPEYPRIETAYPIRDSAGRYNSVRVIGFE